MLQFELAYRATTIGQMQKLQTKKTDVKSSKKSDKKHHNF